MSVRRLLFLFCSLLLLVTSFSPVTAETSDGVNVPTSQFVFGVYTAWETTYIPGYTDTAANRADKPDSIFDQNLFPRPYGK